MIKKFFLSIIFSGLTLNSYSFMCDNLRTIPEKSVLELKQEYIKYAYEKDLTLKDWIEFLIKISEQANNPKIDQAISELIPSQEKSTEAIINKILEKEKDYFINILNKISGTKNFVDFCMEHFQECIEMLQANINCYIQALNVTLNATSYRYYLISEDKRKELDYLFDELKLDSNKEFYCGQTKDNKPIYLSPIFLATFRGNLDLVKYLIKKGADINTTNMQNDNLLHVAIQSQNLELIEFLSSFESLINKANDYKETPIFVASFYGNLDAIKILQKHNADLLFEDQSGRTPLDIAILLGNFDIVDFIAEDQKLENKNDLVLESIDNLLRLALSQNTPFEFVWKLNLENKIDINIADSENQNILDYLTRIEADGYINPKELDSRLSLLNSYIKGLMNKGCILKDENGEIKAIDQFISKFNSYIRLNNSLNEPNNTDIDYPLDY